LKGSLFSCFFSITGTSISSFTESQINTGCHGIATDGDSGMNSSSVSIFQLWQQMNGNLEAIFHVVTNNNTQEVHYWSISDLLHWLHRIIWSWFFSSSLWWAFDDINNDFSENGGSTRMTWLIIR
jgi:hypothetical protein